MISAGQNNAYGMGMQGTGYPGSAMAASGPSFTSIMPQWNSTQSMFPGMNMNVKLNGDSKGQNELISQNMLYQMISGSIGQGIGSVGMGLQYDLAVQGMNIQDRNARRYYENEQNRQNLMADVSHEQYLLEQKKLEVYQEELQGQRDHEEKMAKIEKNTEIVIERIKGEQKLEASRMLVASGVFNDTRSDWSYGI